MAQNIDLFVSENGTIRGPVRLDEIRREIASGELKDALFRMEGCKRFLPGSAWDPLSDLFSAPSPPDPPEGAVAESLPRDLAKLEPAPRDKLLWFVEDADGVMGPVTGAFVTRGLMTGRIPINAAVALVSVPGWIRGTSVFPAALESATAIRARPLGTFTCPYCLEPVIVGSKNCLMCGEAVALGEPELGARRGALVALAGLLVVLAPLVGGVLTARTDSSRASAPATGATETASSASAQPALLASSAGSSMPFVEAKPSSSARPASSATTGKLAGEVVAKIDVPGDADSALLLPHGNVAVFRRSALDVIDPRSGVVVTSSREAPSARFVERADGALYAVLPSRIAVVEPDSLRVLRTIEPRAQLAAGAAASDLVLYPSPSDRSVVVLGTQHHVELFRFRFGVDVPQLVGVDPVGDWGVSAVGDPKSRTGPDAIQVFAPRTSPRAQVVRRLALGAPITALSVQDGHAFVALSSSRVVRVALDQPGLLTAPELTRETCSEPAIVRSARGAVLVGCRGGRALSLHAPATLAQDTRLELGGPVLSIEISPSGSQALVVVGAPAAGLLVVDLASGEPVRVKVTDEISTARFGVDGSTATAFSARAHRVWVLK